MEKEGGTLNKVYIWLSVIVTVEDGIGRFLGHTYMCIGAAVALVLLTICSLAIKCNKIKKLKRKNEKKLLRLEERHACVERELLEEELTEIERKDKERDGAALLQDIAAAKRRYFTEEAVIIKESKKRLLAYGAAFALLLVVNAEPIYTYAINLTQNVSEQGTTKDDEKEDEKSAQVENKTTDNSEGEGEKDVQEGKDKSDDLGCSGVIVYGMTFYLDDPTREWIPTPEMEEAVFYVDKDNIDIHDIVKQHMQNLIDKNLKDTYNGCLSPGEERLAASAAERETIFDNSREMVKQYAAEGNYTEWKKELRHSAYLDDIIKDRNELWDSGKRNSTLASLQANTDQDYALEYQNQGKSGYTILSYYLETIRWSELALSYEGADKKKIFNYIKARYWDIATCQAIPQKYRDNAEAIYLEMGEYEDYIK